MRDNVMHQHWLFRILAILGVLLASCSSSEDVDYHKIDISNCVDGQCFNQWAHTFHPSGEIEVGVWFDIVALPELLGSDIPQLVGLFHVYNRSTQKRSMKLGVELLDKNKTVVGQATKKFSVEPITPETILYDTYLTTGYSNIPKERISEIEYVRAIFEPDE